MERFSTCQRFLGSYWPMALWSSQTPIWMWFQGGGEIEVRNFPQFRNFSQFSAIFRNFPQFSAIFPQFFTLPDFLTASPRWCRTMRIFFFYYSIHSQMLQSHQNLV